MPARGPPPLSYTLGAMPARRRGASEFTASSFADTVDQPLVITDRSLSVLAWNMAMEQLTGCTHVDAVGRPADQVLPFLADRRIADCVQSALAGKEARTDDFPFEIPGPT